MSPLPPMQQNISAMTDPARGQLTASQQAIVADRGASLVISAAAGSGKTRVLVERLLDLVVQGEAELNQVLVVTFTELAAAEMKLRVGRRLDDLLAKDSENVYLRRQRLMLGQAPISTIHAFCLRTIRRYFHVLGIDPGLRPLDEQQRVLLQGEALDALFERLYAAPDNQSFLDLVDCSCDFGDRNLRQQVLQLHARVFSMAHPECWLQEAPTALVDDGARVCREILTGQAVDSLDRVSLLIQAARRFLSPDQEKCLATLDDDLEVIERCRAQRESWMGLVESIKNARLGRISAAPPEVVKLRDVCRGILTGLREKIWIAHDVDVLLAQMRATVPRLQRLCGLVREFDDEFLSLKQRDGWVDFNDMERLTLRLLHHDGVREELRAAFKCIMVDEFQDVNPLQDELITRLTCPAGTNAFTVGDVKQSIYRFRHSEPENFNRRIQAAQTDGKVYKHLPLAENFRSRGVLLEGINAVFNRIMVPALGGVDYLSGESLKQGAGHQDEPAETSEASPTILELHLVRAGAPAPLAADGEQEADTDTDVDYEPIGELEELGALEQQAAIMAERINRMTGVIDSSPLLLEDEGQVRPVRLQDIVVLLRSTRDKAVQVAEMLQRQGIHTSAKPDTRLLATDEGRMVRALLLVIDNPRQDIPLAAVLHAPFCGWTTNHLALLRSAGRQGDLWDALGDFTAGDLGELGLEVARKRDDFMPRLKRWRDLARQVPLAELLHHLFDDTGYHDWVGGRDNGRQRQQVLNVFLEQARVFDAAGSTGLFRFLRQLDEMEKADEDIELPPLLSEAENAVRVMTVHAAKGLEFPVVILADCQRQFHADQGPIMADRQALCGLFVDPEQRYSLSTLGYEAVKYREQKQQRAEEMRLLYVALTRACQHLLVIGSEADRGRPCLTRWLPAVCAETTLPLPALVQARCFLDWLMPALCTPEQLISMVRGALPVCSLRGGWKLISHPPQAGQALQPDDSLLGIMANGAPLADVCVTEKFRTQLQRLTDYRYPGEAVLTLPAKSTVTALPHLLSSHDAATGRPSTRQVSEGSRAHDPPSPTHPHESLPESDLRREELDDAAEEHAAPHPILLQARSYPRPEFLSRGVVAHTAADAGTAVHLALAHLHLNGMLDASSLNEQLAAMVHDRVLTEPQRLLVNVSWLTEFFAGPLGRRLVGATGLERELRFTWGISPAQFAAINGSPGLEMANPDPGPATDLIVVQGAIDCLWQDANGLVLLDYKTDRADGSSDVILRARHQMQLTLYAQALAACRGVEVKEAWVVYLTQGRVFEVLH